MATTLSQMPARLLSLRNPGEAFWCLRAGGHAAVKLAAAILERFRPAGLSIIFTSSTTKMFYAHELFPDRYVLGNCGHFPYSN